MDRFGKSELFKWPVGIYYLPAIYVAIIRHNIIFEVKWS